MLRQRHGLLVLIIVGLVTSPVAAQAPPAVPPCGARPAEAPCRADVDSAPVLEYQPPVPETGEQPRTPSLWIYVDSTGAVRKAQVHRPAGIDWDRAAIERAKEFRFRPATLSGYATSAWVYLTVVGVPPPATCANSVSSVPVSAGGQFVDSTVLDRPELGTQFRYEAPAGFPMDVFMYPASPSPSPEVQVRDVLQALAAGLVTGGPDSIRILREGRRRIKVQRRGSSTTFDGYGARLVVMFDNVPGESSILVFPSGEHHLKFRATYPRNDAMWQMFETFVEQILSHQAWRAQGCPR